MITATNSTPTKLTATPIAAASGSTLLQSPAQLRSDTQRPSGGWLELRIWAEMFNDAQQQRIAAANRARYGVDPIVYEAYTDSAKTAEHVCRLALRNCYKRVAPKQVRKWQQGALGIGEDLFSRLLGHLGDARWATPHHWEGKGSKRVLIADEPYDRTVSQLWQYCGHGRPGRIKKGSTFDELAAHGSPTLKMIVHLNAEAAVKAGLRKYPDAPKNFTIESRYPISAFGSVYMAARLKYTDKTHTVPCVRCGPSGKPAAESTPWSAGHQHAGALRIVGKEILRDLWKVAA